MTRSEGEVNGFARLVRAFRAWAQATEPIEPPPVAGASADEAQLLAALGGLAAPLAGSHLEGWPDACRRWAQAAPAPPSELVERVEGQLDAGEEVLAALYNACISAKSRRRLGTVFTPQPVVDHMLGLVEAELEGDPAVIVDPGAGVGAFSVSAARRWPRATTIAIDVNPVTLGLLAARIAFEIDRDSSRAETYRGIDLRLGSYLDLVEEIYGGAAGPIAALGNPPYTRVQQLPRHERLRAGELTAGIIDSGHANLAGLIQAMTFAQMRPQDVSCMILPGSISYTRAALGLRRRLWRSNRRLGVERWPAAQRLFVGHSVQAAILTIGRAVDHPGPLRLARVESDDGEVRASDSRTLDRDGDEPANWFVVDTTPPSEGTVPLGNLAKIRRGVATGANEMFFLDDETAARFPKQVVSAGIKSLRGFHGECLDPEAHRKLGGRRWLLTIPPEMELSGDLEAYVREFEDAVKDRHLPSQRPLWYSLPVPQPPPILIAPLSKGDFRIVTNPAGAIPSNSLFGIHPVSESDTDRLTAWLRSSQGQRELRRVSRRYPGGSRKLEPKALASARIPIE